MINVVSLDHIQMMVGSLEKSIEFYITHFGFVLEQTGNRMGERWAIIKASNAPVCLALIEDAEGVLQKKSGLRIFHFGLVVDRFMETFDYLKSQGIVVEPQDYVIEYEGSRSFYFFDIDGHKIEISEFECGNI